jgi:hypothetical protein
MAKELQVIAEHYLEVIQENQPDTQGNKCHLFDQDGAPY